MKGEIFNNFQRNFYFFSFFFFEKFKIFCCFFFVRIGFVCLFSLLFIAGIDDTKNLLLIKIYINTA